MQDYQLIKLIKEAESIRGTGSSLISFYTSSNLQQAISRLQAEITGSQRIKSKQTRTTVEEGLQKMLHKIREYKAIPEGLAMFYGENTLLVYEPQSPLNVNIYSCDAKFKLDALYSLLRPQQTYALCVLDGKEGTIATMRGSEIRIIKEMDSLIPPKVQGGGQSAQRYERITEQATKAWFVRLADVINQEFQQNKFDWLICGGCGGMKDAFLKAKLLNYQIKVKPTFNVGYTSEHGIYELIHNAKEVFEQDEIAIEEREFNNFKNALEEGKAFSGREAIAKLGMAKKILISREKIGEIDLNNSKTEIIVMDSNNHFGKEFLLGFNGISCII